jgi:stage II sporulation protein P
MAVLPDLVDRDRYNEDGVGGMHMYTPWWIDNKKLDFGWAYSESRPLVQEAMASNRDLQYFIDIHRDARRKDATTVMINGQAYAQLAFVIGGKNPNHEQNEKLAIDLHNLLEKKYKGLSWGIHKNQGAGQNGVYNQNLSKNAILIEFGGVDNTFEEINRSVAALADVFSEYYWQAEKVNQDVEQTTDKQ